jgi:multimeric flavodoxin WrbA
MTITIIHSSPSPNSSSSAIARNLASKFDGAEILEINLQKENLPYCKGCLLCLKKGIEYCPHHEIILPAKEKILKADLIIVATPVYILHMNGQLKTFIDHFSSWFLMHRPELAMFKKQLVVIATSAGPVYKNTLKEVSECFTYFGIPKIYKMGTTIQSESFKKLPDAKKDKIDRKCSKIASKVKKVYKNGKYHTPVKSKFNFMIYRKIQQRVAMDTDRAYWNENGWFDKKRPWKN